jgi:DNA-binding transcriptional LysR family regulator
MQYMHHESKRRPLRTFVTVVEAGGIHQAVARINLSQPPASRQISALEAALGVQLFDRIGRHLKLTAEGEGLLRLSRRLLEDVEIFNERAAALKKGETGILRVAATLFPTPLNTDVIEMRRAARDIPNVRHAVSPAHDRKDKRRCSSDGESAQLADRPRDDRWRSRRVPPS